MYKLMTGRVPFRGKTAQALRESIVTAPLRWPDRKKQDHSATTAAKDLAFRMLRKNASDRLGSQCYSDLKTHPFFDRFNWKRLHRERHLCDIPCMGELLKAMRSRSVLSHATHGIKRFHLKLSEMADVTADLQRPLLCYSSDTFKKLFVAVVRRDHAHLVNDQAFDIAEGHAEGVQLVGAEAFVFVGAGGLPRELESRVHRGSCHCHSRLTGARADDERILDRVVAGVAVPVVEVHGKPEDESFAATGRSGEENL
ncbi:hypothetical protein HPB48_026292 [Haemaphysalis longicornis]|uniref:non-specific serine/threonine protein kinase n=1 Tax=Haemaphysalis longicornis TaxID=44386 RepID=A0A9J6H997_HAELO|nr:hypothetical protein HPB48_026292 [Haemaphysalis longicornis]